MRYRSRRQFSEEFKRAAVARSLTSDRPLAEVGAELGVSRQLLSRWRREWVTAGSATVKNAGPSKSAKQLERENARLKKQLKRAEQEKEILKKAQEYFTKNQR